MEKEISHEKAINEKPSGILHECKQCGYAVTRKEKLNRHIKYEHEGAEWKYKCDKCNKSFKESKYFNIHVRVNHEKSLYNCNQEGCEAFFHTPDGLRGHKNRVHYAISKYKCESCNKLFVGDVHLNVHKSAVHEGIILKCDLCDYTYTSHDSYKKHKSRHNKIDTEPKYKCDKCGKYFRQKGNFDLHVKVHHEKSTFDCDEDGCKAFYLSPQGLSGHKIRVHHANVKYKSSIVNRKRYKPMQKKLNMKKEDLENCGEENIKSAQKNSNIRDQRELKKESDNNYDFKYACPYCNEEYATPEEMGPHIANHI